MYAPIAATKPSIAIQPLNFSASGVIFLDCGVEDNNKTVLVSNPNNETKKTKSFPKYSNSSLCDRATLNGDWNYNHMNYVSKANSRGLDCGVKDKKTITASKQNKKSKIDITSVTCTLMPSMM